jgi:hypothetical protein
MTAVCCRYSIHTLSTSLSKPSLRCPTASPIASLLHQLFCRTSLFTTFVKMVGLTEPGWHNYDTLDIFNNLSLDPHVDTISSLKDIQRQMRKTALKLHTDRLRHYPAPPNTDLARMNDLVDRLKNSSVKTQDRIIRLINAGGKAGWKSTWHLSNDIGSWSPLPSYHIHSVPASTPHAPASAHANPASTSYPAPPSTTSPPPTTTSPFERQRRPYTTPSRHTTTGEQRYEPSPPPSPGRLWSGEQPGSQCEVSPSVRLGRRQQGGSPGSSIPIIDSDEEEAITISEEEGKEEKKEDDNDELLSIPRCQQQRFTRMGGTAQSFRYKMSLPHLRRLGRRLQTHTASNAIVAIGVVRRKQDTNTSNFPEYVVTAALTRVHTAVSFRVWRQDIEGRPLSWWAENRSTVIARADINALGYHFSPFDSMTQDQLRQFMIRMVSLKGNIPPGY